MNKGITPRTLYSQTGPDDEYYTPDYALEPLLKYIPKHWVVWDSTERFNTSIRRFFDDHGYLTWINTLDDYLTDPDPGSVYNITHLITVTNPPYSLKNEFLARAYEIKQPFAFLLPLTALESAKRQQMFRDHGVQIILMDNRIDFHKGTSGAWFPVAWFTWQLGLPSDLVFEHINKPKKVAK